MKEIHLHGELAERFGSEPFMLDAKTPQMLTRGMICRFGNEFRKIIREGTFEFLCLKDGKKEYIHDEMTACKVVDADEVHLTPVLAGSGRFGQIILGIVLIVVGFYTGQGWLVSSGVGLVVGGVVQLLTPVPSFSAMSNERPDARPSFVFNGAVNTYEQRGPVPLCYGRFKCGSVIVSAGFDVERIAFNVNVGPRYDDNDGDGPRRGDGERR